MGKTLEKQTKTLKDQGKKQIKAIEDREKQLVQSNGFISKNDYDTQDNSLLKEKEIYNEIVAERKNDMSTLNNEIKFK